MGADSICIAILGPTASGKSQFALQLAESLGGELICLDSTTVYKQFDIGSAKPSFADQQKVPHHLIDILQPDDTFDAKQFISLADKSIRDIQERNRVPIVVGGTYFYLKALQNGMFPVSNSPPEVIEAIEAEFCDEENGLDLAKLHAAVKAIDPESGDKIHPKDRYRLVRALVIWRVHKVKPSELKPKKLPNSPRRIWLKYAVTLSRHQLTQKIADRTLAFFKKGLLEEVASLKQDYPNSKALNSVGYRECVQHLHGEIERKDLENKVIEKTRKLAKRQVTWLRSDPEMRFVDALDIKRVVLEYKNLSHVLLGGIS